MDSRTSDRAGQRIGSGVDPGGPSDSQKISERHRRKSEPSWTETRSPPVVTTTSEERDLGQEAATGGTTWEKVLHKEQPFEDNYTDGSFLEALVLNAHVKQRDYWTVVRDSAAVVQQLNTTALVVAMSVHLYRRTVGVETMMAVCAAVLLAGSLLCCTVGGHILGGTVARGFRQCFLLTAGVYLMSPLLRTLTWTISTDTIISSSCLLLLVHLYLHDYNFVNSVTDKLTGSVSLGSAVFASVLIASRLPSYQHVFVQILFSLELYLLGPFVRRYIRQMSTTIHLLLTVASLVGSVLLVAPLSPVLTVLYCLTVLLVSFVCPLALVRLHKFKAKINGPWDEAVPSVPVRLVHRLRSRRESQK